MSGSLDSSRDLARYFNTIGISIRPDAVRGLLGETMKLKYHDEKLRYLDTVCTVFKEWHQTNNRLNTAQSSSMILDAETAGKII